MPYLHKFAHLCLITCLTPLFLAAQGPTAGQNVNMVSGTDWTTGDPFLQRQNEPSIAVSTRNSSHLLAGANDYRTVDLPGLMGIPEQGDAWLGVFKSFDGGQTWRSTLLPGYPLDSSLAGLLSPVHGFQAAADPMVRAGTNGLLYYSGIAFNRGPGGLSEVFVSRFIDRNNKENGDPTNEVGSMTNVVPKDPLRYTGEFPIAFGSDDRFLDKPSLAVDIPRGTGNCTIVVPENNTLATETVPQGNVYLAYTVLFTPDGDDDDKAGLTVPASIMFTSSSNCGYTWNAPKLLSGSSNMKNQGSVIAIDPNTGTVYVAWRRFSASNTQPDAILITKSTDGGNTFTSPVAAVTFPSSCAPPPAGDPTQPGCPFDQGGSTAFSPTFRTNDYPALAVDGSGRVYLSWSQRNSSGDSRIMMMVSGNGTSWSQNAATAVDVGPVVDDSGSPLTGTRGHQFMPSLSFNAGELTLGYYDLRQDHTIGIFTPRPNPACSYGSDFPCQLGAQYAETRLPVEELSEAAPLGPDSVFTNYVLDSVPTLATRRHTMDVEAAQAAPQPAGSLSVPAFKSFRVSRYNLGLLPTYVNVPLGDSSSAIQQMQFNPPDLPLFVMGTAPFIGDYIEVAGSPTMVFDNSSKKWKFNTASVPGPVFHAVWADNRDVRPPADGNWQHYTPPFSASVGGTSKFDPTQPVPACLPGQTGMRNQNIYTSKISQGIVVSSLQTSKPLLNSGSPGIQRAFTVIVQNATNSERSFQMAINISPSTAGLTASFMQFGPPQLVLPVSIPAFSSIARSVFVQATTSSGGGASIIVNVASTDAGNALQGSVVLNSDPSNPTLLNPDNATFGGTTILTQEFYNPTTGNPTTGNTSNNNSLLNPTTGNPTTGNITTGNPTTGNPTTGNVLLSNPTAITALPNPTTGNPTTGNPTTGNPTTGNPTTGNPTTGNTAVNDAVFPITDAGNTGASYTVQLFKNGSFNAPLQLILSKPYGTTAVNVDSNGNETCQLVTQYTQQIVANIPNAVFTAASNLGNPTTGNAAITNATMALAPGEFGQITVRSTADYNTIIQNVTPVITAQAVNTVDAAAGSTQPSLSVPGGSSIFITNTLPGGGNPLPNGVSGTVYRAQLTSIGGVGTITWGFTGQSSLFGSGLTLSPNGLISGTAAAPGNYFFTVLATDSATPKPNTAVANLEIQIAQVLTITSTTLPQAIVGVPYGPQQLTGTGGTPPYCWSNSAGTCVTGAVPIGNGFLINNSGQITGTPQASGITQLTVYVSDNGQATSGTVSIPVSPASGDLIVADGSPSAATSRLLRINPFGLNSNTIATFTGVADGVAVDPNTGNFYVAVQDLTAHTSKIVRVTPFGVQSTFVNDASLQDALPHGWVEVAVDSAGNVYVGDNAADAIYKFDHSGTSLGRFGTIPSSPGDLQDIKMVFDSNGNLVVASDGVGNAFGVEIDRISPTGTVEQIYPTNTQTTAAIKSVGGLAIAPSGDYVVADFIAGSIVDVSSPGTGNTNVTVQASGFAGNMTGLVITNINTAYDVLVNGVASGIPLLVSVQGSNINPLITGTPLSFPNDMAQFPSCNSPSGITICVSLSSTTATIEGALVPYTARLSNNTGTTVSSVLVQAYIDQGATSRAAGGAVIRCTPTLGELPAGNCDFSWDLVASNQGGGTGTLVPGAATARFELRQFSPDRLLQVSIVPITLQSIVTVQ